MSLALIGLWLLQYIGQNTKPPKKPQPEIILKYQKASIEVEQKHLLFTSNPVLPTLCVADTWCSTATTRPGRQRVTITAL